MAEAVSLSPAIRSWDCSYYNNKTRQWIYGQLALLPLSLHFGPVQSKSDAAGADKSYDLNLSISQIRDITKARSSYLFHSIVVTTEDNETLWFSSFAKRGETFLFLKHFIDAIRTKVLSRSTFHTHKADCVRTELGTKLLRSVNDSEKNLAKAAESLVGQGHQLANAASTVEMMHEDLNVAGHITSGLDSWFGRWRLPTLYTPEKIVVVRNNDIPELCDVEVLCSFISKSTFGPQIQCVFRVSKEGLTVLDMKQKVLHNFKWKDVSRIRVVSPWEVMVTQFAVGQADFSYSIVSVQMPTVLQKLEKFGSSKLEYITPPPQLDVFENCSEKASSPVSLEPSYQDATPKHTESFLDGQAQMSCKREVVSNLEIDELTEHLKRLKSLAMDVGEEEDRQLKLIDNVTCSVTRADNRVRKLNSKVKGMLD